MTKRASGKYPRKPRDSYATPYEAVVPLLPHLAKETWFDEPCQGHGHLVNHLKKHGHIIVNATDIQDGYDALEIERCDGSMFITNPPWSRPILHKLITHLSDIAPTWLLIDADWMHTKQSIPFMDRLVTIVSVGRISWMGNGTVGFDDCVWLKFCQPSIHRATRFYGRVS